MKKVSVVNGKVVVEVDGAKVTHSMATIQKVIKQLTEDLEMWRNYERLLTQRAADYEPPCPDCGKPMAEQRPGKYECLNPKCGS